jgi:hypothetical protein
MASEIARRLGPVALLAALAGGGGFLAGRRPAPPAPIADPSVARLDGLEHKLDALLAQSSRPARAAVADGPGRALSPEQAEQLATRVAEELGASERPPPSPPRTAENIHAFDSTHALVESAEQKGHWTEADRERFQLLAPDLTSEDRQTLGARLCAAANRAEVAVDYRGPLF